MSNTGRFLVNHFKGKEVYIFTGIQAENVHYADSDLSNWTILRGIPVEYDEECGVLTLKSTKSDNYFYLNDWHLQSFWEPRLDYFEITGDTLHKKRDIM